MPELPEVETVRAGLEPFLVDAMIDRVVLNRDGLRFPFPPEMARKLTGQRVIAARRRAKYLLFELADGTTWMTHLGMTGNYRINGRDTSLGAAGAPDAQPVGRHDHVLVDLTHPAKGPLILSYSDPRRFGFMDLVEDVAEHPRLRDLGPEPLGNGFSAIALANSIAGRRAPIKSLLLDQRIVAGLGNIYVCEALFRARISPFSLGASLVKASGKPSVALERLCAAVRTVLQEAIVAGGSTLNDFRHADGESGYFQHAFAVYGRQGEPCATPGCTGKIVRSVQAGRSSFFCPRCQPSPRH